ncbi:Hypothetical protein A7982_04528 [Minicystis rosea]|nr:Hypothetical protein A7982_04528 [Minicystis rosea]
MGGVWKDVFQVDRAAATAMSQQEIERAEWMLRVRERRATQAQVAERLGLSVRQVERLYRAYKAGGAAALVSKKRASSGRYTSTCASARSACTRRSRASAAEPFGPQG